MNTDVRVANEDRLSRSGEILVGSNPTQCILYFLNTFHVFKKLTNRHLSLKSLNILLHQYPNERLRNLIRFRRL